MTSVASMRTWTDFEPESGRWLRQTWVISAVAHLCLLSLVIWWPSSRPTRVVPQAITVSLLAAVPAPPAAPKPAVKAAPKAPVPKAKPVPAPKPKPRPKIKVLPKKAPTPVAQAVKRKPRPEELSYDDALAKLRGDLGESAPVAPTPAPIKASTPVAATAEVHARLRARRAPEAEARGGVRPHPAGEQDFAGHGPRPHADKQSLPINFWKATFCVDCWRFLCSLLRCLL